MNSRYRNPFILTTWMILELLTQAVLAEAPQRILWEKAPIRLELRVGTERIVHFPGPVTLGLPQHLTGSLRAQSLDGTVYLSAHTAFETARIQVRSTAGTPIYLLDVEAKEHAPAGPTVQVELPPASVLHSDPGGAGRTFGYVTLTRFAARKLYAPKRLAKDVPGIVRVPVSSEPRVLVRGAGIEARALASWRAGSRFVTAVQLINQSPRPHTLDARALRGEWLTATFQHHRLHAAGSDADTTALYLISAHPFDEAAPAP
ncbi:MAG: TIGR03749 family integrating conjugative element protein [Gammaproteobacteria bacterium]|nr:TIGR03749 family integrating conjugative element protein [Gammaproteobacteria bacterium]